MSIKLRKRLTFNGKELGIIHQLCYDHGIHLAVQKVVYKKVQEDKMKLRNGEDGSADEGSDESDSEEEDQADDEEFRVDLGRNVNQMRKIVKLFKKSRELNGRLQQLVVEKLGKNLQLQLDVCTRWNSLLSMVRTFSRIGDPVKEVLTETNHLEMWNNKFRLAIDQLFIVLNVAEMTMNEISKDEATLLTADGAFEFLFDELQGINSKLNSLSS